MTGYTPIISVDEIDTTVFDLYRCEFAIRRVVNDRFLALITMSPGLTLGNGIVFFSITSKPPVYGGIRKLALPEGFCVLT